MYLLCGFSALCYMVANQVMITPLALEYFSLKSSSYYGTIK